MPEGGVGGLELVRLFEGGGVGLLALPVEVLALDEL